MKDQYFTKYALGIVNIQYVFVGFFDLIYGDYAHIS